MWVLYSSISVILWSLVNIADSYLVEKNKKIGHPIGALVIFSSIYLIFFQQSISRDTTIYAFET